MLKNTLLIILSLPFLIWSFTNSSSTEPGDIKVSIIGEDVKIEWTGFSGINSYIIEVATDTDKSGQLIFSSLAEIKDRTNGYKFSYLDKTTNKSGIRYYRIKHVQSQSKYILSDVKTANFLYKDNFTVNISPDYDQQTISLEVNSRTNGEAAIKITGLNTSELFEDNVYIKKGFTKEEIKVPAKLNTGIVLVSFSYRGDTQHVMLRKDPVQNFMVVSEE